MKYTPDYDTTIRTRTVVEKLETRHRDGIDWSYPFDDPEHTAHMCSSEEAKREEIAKVKNWLRVIERAIERGEVVQASNYGGWPRIWHRVLWIGMASCWPYWKPRPTVAVDGTLGAECYDWLSLTGAQQQ